MSETFQKPFNADYEILGLLGKGGMGSNVYKARQVKLDRIVALKVLDSMGDSEAEQRFYSEAKAMKELNHQNLATVFDFGTHEDKIFIAMTFIDGQSLADKIKKEKILSVKNAIFIAQEIAKGLEYAHKRGVVHRDIKPSNIMMMANGEPCVIDFGISLTSGSQRLTSTGMTMGTPEYMSPEQCHNKNVTLQSDIYSLGIVFYEMLSGDPPFMGAQLQVMNKHLHEKPVSLRKKNTNVPDYLEKIIEKCLEKKIDNRYANFSGFIEDLNMAGNEVQGTAKKNTVFVSRLSKTERAIFSILCILITLLVLLIPLLAFKSPPKSPPSINYLTPAKSWVIQNVQPEIPIAPLFDGDLSSAWTIPKNSALKANSGILITIRFPKPTLISNLGIAVGDQSNWDNFQKYNKPKDIWIRYANSSYSAKENNVNEQSSIKKITLEDKLGVQYVSWVPVEVTELMFEMKSMMNDSKPEDLAISEIRIFGIEF
jgi:serine/threonine protein kinase